MNDSLLYKRSVIYNEASLLLYLIGLEVSNLLGEIRDKSPIASKYIPEDALLTPNQIEEALNDFTGFVKLAIVTVAERQDALNYVTSGLDKIEEHKSRLEGAITTVLQNQQRAAEDALDNIYQMLDNLRNQEDKLFAIQTKLKDIATSIDTLLEQHSAEWHDHHQKYAEELISKLEKNDIVLNDLEKQELLSPKKTTPEIVESLQKIGVIKT